MGEGNSANDRIGPSRLQVVFLPGVGGIYKAQPVVCRPDSTLNSSAIHRWLALGKSVHLSAWTLVYSDAT